jgi:hypothetical protein
VMLVVGRHATLLCLEPKEANRQRSRHGSDP